MPRPLSTQLLLQHWLLAVQVVPLARQLAAAAAVGATIELTRGTLTAAAIPRCFMRTLRDIPFLLAGLTNGSSKRRDFPNCSRAIQITSFAAVEFILSSSS